jgi:hypothetical protein
MNKESHHEMHSKQIPEIKFASGLYSHIPSLRDLEQKEVN